MKPLCTTLLSSYKRPHLLMVALESLQSKADQSQYQVIVRLSKEDPTHEDQTRHILDTYKNVSVLVGPHRGYQAIGDYFTRMAELAIGEWVHIFDDDMTIDGDWWSELLIAPIGHMVLCESYTCGGSGYGPGSCDGPGIAWWVPNGCWKKLGEPAIGFPPDTWMRRLLIDRHGWPIHHLKGVRLNHQWQRPVDGSR